MTGVFQIFFTIYQPCWADVFGNEIQKSKWLAYLIITTPLGVVLGYCMCAIFIGNDISWKFAFYVQSLLLLPSFFGILYFDAQYFDIKLLSKRQKEMQETQRQAKILSELDNPKKGKELLEEGVKK